MFLQKISILLVILLLSFFQPEEVTQQNINPYSNNTYFLFNHDSLKNKINTSGWDDSSLNSLHFYLINSEANIKDDESLIKDLPSGYEKSFLYSLLLKKQMKFNDMYDSLFQSLNQNPVYPPYYEELIFSASATNKIDSIENRLDSETKLRQETLIKGLLSSSKGNYEDAVKYFKELSAIDSLNKNLFYLLSYAYRNTGDYQSARNILKDAEKKFPEDAWFAVKAAIAEGSLFFLSGDYKNAKILYNRGYQLALQINDKQNIAKSYINLGIIEDNTGDVEKARELFSRAINISSLIHDNETLAIAYSELGVSYTFTNNLVEAKYNYLKSEELFENLGNRSRLSFLSNNIGRIYLTLFDYRSALKYFEKGIVLGGDDRTAKVINLTGIADVYTNLSNYTKAIQYYREAQKISSEIKDISLDAEINSGLGSLNFNLDRFNNALQYYSIAKDYAQKIESPDLLSDLEHKIGISYLMMDSLKSAEEFFLSSLLTAKKFNIHRTASLVSLDLALLYLSEKDFNKANDYTSDGQKIAKDYSFDYLAAKGKLVDGQINEAMGNFINAEKLFKEAIEISAKLNEFRIQTEAYYLLGKMFDKNGFYEAAESYYLSAFNLINNVSRPLFEEEEVQISYFSAQKDVYESLAELYLKQNKYQKAFELIDKSRSRNMVQNLSNLKLQAILEDEDIVEKIYEYEWIIHSNIYSKTESDSVKKEYAELKKNLVSKNPEIEKYLNPHDSPTLNEIQKNLADKENILSFHTTENETFIFLISNKDFKTYKVQIGTKDLLMLRNKISPYYENNNTQSTAFYNQDLFSFNAKAAFELYDKVFKNVLKEIPEQQKIIISPSTELISLPFDFLVTSFSNEESAYNYYNKNYLIYKYNISTIPSAAVYLHQRKNSMQNEDKILIVGNPAINNEAEGFSERRGLLEESSGIPRNVAVLPLKYSEEEVNQINSLIDADRVLLNDEATETRFKEDAELSKVIHLSTHSFLFNKQPVIFFTNSDDDENDGFLEAGEIVQLKLNSDLVVLSSCNSGLGSIDEAEGIIGMTKAFFEAGAKSVVVSLWEVNDKYTARLMTLFYKKLSEGLDKDDALRQAKIDFIKQHSPNPYYWSAFVISGNSNPLVLKSKINIQPYLGGALVILVLVTAVIIFKRRKT